MIVNLIPANSILWVILKASVYKVEADRSYLQPVANLILAFLNLKEEFLLISCEEWIDTCYQHEKINSYTPDVCFVCVRPSLHDLWRHHQRCPAVGLHNLLNTFQLLREA